MGELRWEHADEQAHDASAKLELGQLHDRLEAAVDQAVVQRHGAEQSELQERHGWLNTFVQQRHEQQSGQDAQRDVGRQLDLEAAATFQQAQYEQVQVRQEFELAVLDRLARAAAETEERQGQRLEQLVHSQVDAIRDQQDRVASQLREDMRAMADAVAGKRQGHERQAQFAELLRQQSDFTAQLRADTRDLIVQLDRQLAPLRSQLTDDQLVAMRSRLPEELRQLPDESLHRAAIEAAVQPAQRALDDAARARLEAAAVHRVKGQLAEELLAQQIVAELSALNQGRPADRQLEFIAGDRIRDEQGKKLTDGVLAWQDREHGTWQIVKAFEVKAGEPSARALNRTLEELSDLGRAETRAYALDLARRELLEGQYGARQQHTAEEQARWEVQRLAELTDQDRRRLAELTDKHEQELLLRRTQIEAGQLERTVERLDIARRILVDGQEQRLAADRRRVEVIGVVPEDVQKRREDLLHLPVGQAELTDAGRLFVEELLRRKRRP